MTTCSPTLNALACFLLQWRQKLFQAPCVAFLGIALICANPSFAAAEKGRRCLAIVGTNDMHGALESQVIKSRDGKAAVSVGGVSILSGYVRALRDIFRDRLLLLDAGDIFWGSLASNMGRGRPMVEAMNKMGYAAATIGNHEFDFGPTPEAPSNRTGELQARMKEADFPFLAVNIIDEKTGQAPRWANFFPSILRDVGGIRVGIIGAATPTTPQTTRQTNVAGLAFLPPHEPIVREARALRLRGAELVVLVAHMGGACARLDDPHDLSSCNFTAQEAELLPLLAKLPPGTLDVAVGGHTHQYIAHFAHGVAVIESGARALKLGYIEACVAAEGGLDMAHTQIHLPTPLCETTWSDATCGARAHETDVLPAQFLGQRILKDDAVVARIAPYLDAVRAQSAAQTGVYLPRAFSQIEIAALVAESMRQSQQTDVGLQNHGGVRRGLPQGFLTFGQLYEAVPFDNDVASVQMHGAALRRFVYRLLVHGVGPEGHTVVGLKRRGPKLEDVVLSSGESIVDDSLYRLATTDFMLQGGDGAPKPEFPPVMGDVSMRETLLALLLVRYPASAAPQTP